MKHLLYILCLFVLSCDSGGGDAAIECASEVYDCANECNGTAVIDICGECGGNNLNSEGYHCTDIEVLQEIINLNLSLQDYTPLSLPNTLWDDNGRLMGLDLHGMSIESIPESIESLTMLKHLLLYDNSLTDIPNNIKNLNNLEELMLGFNLFTEFPSCIYEITSLTGIWIENNEINSSLSTDIGNLTSLQHLNIQNNKFHSIIPESICDLDLLYSDLDMAYIWDSDTQYGGDNETWRGFDIRYNNLCTYPLPPCLTEHNLGYQDCSTP